MLPYNFIPSPLKSQVHSISKKRLINVYFHSELQITADILYQIQYIASVADGIIIFVDNKYCFPNSRFVSDPFAGQHEEKK